MHEVYREYIEYHERRFLVIVFENGREFVLKVFLNRVNIFELPFGLPGQPVANLNGKSPFDQVVSISKEWVLKNY